MSKKVTFGPKPTATQNLPEAADDWVSAGQGESTPKAAETEEEEPMKRLTIDVPKTLHTQIKSKCALRGVKMADEIRGILEEHFREESDPEMQKSA